MIAVAAALLIAPQWTQKLPDGTTVSLVVLTSFTYKQSWKPDGTPLPAWVSPQIAGKMDQATKNEVSGATTAFIFQIKAKAKGDAPSAGFKIGKQALDATFMYPDATTPGVWWAGVRRPSAKLGARADIKVGVASGPWKTSASHDLGTGLTKGPKFFMSAQHAHGATAPATLDVTVPSVVTGKAYRFKVYCTDGSALKPAGIGPSRGRTQSLFFVENGKRFAHVDMQVRPYSWVSFGGVVARAAGGAKKTGR